MKTRMFVVLVLIFLLIAPVGAQETRSSLSSLDTTATVADPDGLDANRLAVRATGVAVQGDYAYVAAGGDGVRIMDVSNPATPSEIAVFPAILARNVAAAGIYAYIADTLTGLRIVNVSDPSTPFEVGTFATSGLLIQNVAVSGIYAYVADFGNRLRVVDVFKPATPTEVGSSPTPDNAYGVAVVGNDVYIAARGRGLRVFDVSDPTNPIETGSLDTPGLALDVAVSEDYAYVADEAQGLRIIDVSGPTPSATNFYDTPGLANGVAVVRNYAYIADGEEGLRIIDISDPMAPTEALWDPTPADAADVAVAEGWVYVADQGENGGLHTVYFAPPTTEIIPQGGGTLDSPFDDTHYVFPPNAFSDTVIITHTPRFASDLPEGARGFGGLVSIGHIFELQAVYQSTGLPAQPQPGFTYTMTVEYSQGELGLAREETLGFYYWDGDEWAEEPNDLAMGAMTITAYPNHLSYWAVLGEPRGVFLPVVYTKH